jgi:hypothetical protein
LGDFIKLVLIICLHKKIALPVTERAITYRCCPLIFQNIRLPELAPMQILCRLLRFHRAGPSTSLDKSAVKVIKLLGGMIPPR